MDKSESNRNVSRQQCFVKSLFAYLCTTSFTK